MKKTIVQEVSLLTHILFFFGIMPITREQARAFFLSAHKADLVWVIWRFRLYMFTKEWEKVFLRWVELCDEERYVKDAFFSIPSLVFGGTTEAMIVRVRFLKNEAALKWLSFLTDFQSHYHRNMVLKLTTDWLPPGSRAYKEACNRRNDFALSLIERGLDDLSLMREAWVYCMEDSAERPYALERIRMLESREK